VRDSRKTVRRVLAFLPRLVIELGALVTKEVRTSFLVDVMFVFFSMETENVLFTYSWPKDETTMQYFDKVGMQALRLYEIAKKAKKSMVRCPGCVVYSSTLGHCFGGSSSRT
jgi:hypothetical protein